MSLEIPRRTVRRRVGKVFLVVLALVAMGQEGVSDDPCNCHPPLSRARDTTVDAGSDRAVEVGDTVELDGSSSGNTGSHKWQFLSQPSGSMATIQDADQLMGASFVADRIGEFEVELVGATSSDPTAPDVNWGETVIPPPGADTTGTDAEQAPSDGVDGVDDPYRSMTHQIKNPSIGEENCTIEDCAFSLGVLHEYAGGRYTPSEMGAIAYIDYSESHIVTGPAFTGAAVGWTFAVWQGGTRYTYQQNPGASAFMDLTWNTEYRCGLTPDDFTPDGLNFENGGQITFGYIRSNTNTSPDSTQRNVHGIDNFRVVIVK
ncbi:MAG: hypothetical protein JRG93_01480 [Deltaproteobacteria bacterium]|nr:hypothetical protein [Deltaproteobacteria bacterium]MBW2223134.1 hypothetical protein [Deltaproteobacteria bacterium]MBW2402456.1 hypothetical protein [Deltaproteobacteria bacterium]MBW2547007.1 hypothetical protein [Deltaproteobacteria bacterium]